MQNFKWYFTVYQITYELTRKINNSTLSLTIGTNRPSPPRKSHYPFNPFLHIVTFLSLTFRTRSRHTSIRWRWFPPGRPGRRRYRNRCCRRRSPSLWRRSSPYPCPPFRSLRCCRSPRVGVAVWAAVAARSPSRIAWRGRPWPSGWWYRAVAPEVAAGCSENRLSCWPTPVRPCSSKKRDGVSVIWMWWCLVAILGYNEMDNLMIDFGFALLNGRTKQKDFFSQRNIFYWKVAVTFLILLILFN